MVFAKGGSHGGGSSIGNSSGGGSHGSNVNITSLAAPETFYGVSQSSFNLQVGLVAAGVMLLAQDPHHDLSGRQKNKKTIYLKYIIKWNSLLFFARKKGVYTV